MQTQLRTFAECEDSRAFQLRGAFSVACLMNLTHGPSVLYEKEFAPLTQVVTGHLLMFLSAHARRNVVLYVFRRTTGRAVQHILEDQTDEAYVKINNKIYVHMLPSVPR